MIKKKHNKTQNRNETNPTISKFTWTVTCLSTLFKGNDKQQTELQDVPKDRVALQSQALFKDGSAILYTPPSVITALSH